MYRGARMRMNVHLGACRQILAQADLCIIFSRVRKWKPERAKIPP